MTQNDQTTTLAKLKKTVGRFITERQWDQFHSPKNLSMSIAIEAAELMEKFQWVPEKESRSLYAGGRERTELEHEVADIAIFLLSISNALRIDLTRAVKAKLRHNAEKYPVDLVKGKYHKYTYYQKNKRSQ
ncbi:MAG: nucleotide pyrophosphohydrolase [Elusimicrobia bacterium]|nr:nucleotide pyrophosphohydrolase [Elusimicrobiota bacterium]